MLNGEEKTLLILPFSFPMDLEERSSFSCLSAAWGKYPTTCGCARCEVPTNNWGTTTCQFDRSPAKMSSILGEAETLQSQPRYLLKYPSTSYLQIHHQKEESLESAQFKWCSGNLLVVISILTDKAISCANSIWLSLRCIPL